MKRTAVSRHSRIRNLSGAKSVVDPKSVDQVLCHDFTRDGRTDRLAIGDVG
jgi:hypothetical protein